MLKKPWPSSYSTNSSIGKPSAAPLNDPYGASEDHSFIA